MTVRELRRFLENQPDNARVFAVFQRHFPMKASVQEAIVLGQRKEDGDPTDVMLLLGSSTYTSVRID